MPTPQESEAWSHRPYLFKGSLADAVRLHKEYADPDAEVMQWRRQIAGEMKRRASAYESTPAYCYPHEHPLRCGRPGQSYWKHDFVTPICDSLTRMVEGNAIDDAFGIFEPPAKKKRASLLDEAEEAHRKEAEKRREPGANFVAGPPPPTWTCPCCANTDVRLQVQLKDALVCKCGYVVHLGGVMVATHREKLGAEESEDKTQHADRVREQTFSKYDRPALTLDERRKERRYAGKISNIGGRVKGLGRMCDAQRISEQTAAKENHQTEVDAGRALTRIEENRGFKIVAHCDDMFQSLAPVDRAVQRTVRKEVDKVWTMAVLHGRKCKRPDCCEVRMLERNRGIIGGAIFDLTLERLIHGDIEFDGSTRQHFIDIQTRMQRSPAFNNASCITQMSTVKAMINVMQSDDFDVNQPCSPAPGPVELVRSPRQGKPPLIKVPFGRNDSSVSCGAGSPPPNEVVQLRDTVSKVFLAHQSELPVSVRDGAYRALQSPGFVDGIKAVDSLKPYSMQCIAFCVLNAVWRAQQADDAARRVSLANVHHCVLNVGIATSLALDLAVAEEAVASIRELVPVDATSEASACADDDLFS